MMFDEMKIKFIKGFKLFDGTGFNYIRYDLGYRVENSIGCFMNKQTMHFRYINKLDLERIADVNESFIFIVIQDNPIETLKTLIHEFVHFVIFKLFCDSEKLHDLLDKIDSPLI
jgi:hypothetical protein